MTQFTAKIKYVTSVSYLKQKYLLFEQVQDNLLHESIVEVAGKIHACPFDKNTARPTEFPCCSSNRLERASVTAPLIIN